MFTTVPNLQNDALAGERYIPDSFTRAMSDNYQNSELRVILRDSCKRLAAVNQAYWTMAKTIKADSALDDKTRARIFQAALKKAQDALLAIRSETEQARAKYVITLDANIPAKDPQAEQTYQVYAARTWSGYKDQLDAGRLPVEIIPEVTKRDQVRVLREMLPGYLKALHSKAKRDAGPELENIARMLDEKEREFMTEAELKRVLEHDEIQTGMHNFSLALMHALDNMTLFSHAYQSGHPENAPMFRRPLLDWDGQLIWLE